MIEPKTYSISAAHGMGVAKVVREAEEEGMVILERNGQRAVMLVSMAPAGFARFFEMLVRAGRTDEKMVEDSDFQQYLSYMVFMLEKKMGITFDLASAPEKEIAPSEPVKPKRATRTRSVKK